MQIFLLNCISPETTTSITSTDGSTVDVAKGGRWRGQKGSIRGCGAVTAALFLADVAAPARLHRRLCRLHLAFSPSFLPRFPRENKLTSAHRGSPLLLLPSPLSLFLSLSLSLLYPSRFFVPGAIERREEPRGSNKSPSSNFVPRISAKLGRGILPEKRRGNGEDAEERERKARVNFKMRL